MKCSLWSITNKSPFKWTENEILAFVGTWRKRKGSLWTCGLVFPLTVFSCTLLCHNCSCCKHTSINSVQDHRNSYCDDSEDWLLNHTSLHSRPYISRLMVLTSVSTEKRENETELKRVMDRTSAEWLLHCVQMRCELPLTAKAGFFACSAKLGSTTSHSKSHSLLSEWNMSCPPPTNSTSTTYMICGTTRSRWWYICQTALLPTGSWSKLCCKVELKSHRRTDIVIHTFCCLCHQHEKYVHM